MLVTSISELGHRPSLLIQSSSAAVLLDCAVDLKSLSSFLPATIIDSPRFESLLKFEKAEVDGGSTKIDYLKVCPDGDVLIDAMPLVNPPNLHAIEVESLDAVLISNWMSIVGLPFLTRQSGFRADVYATDPTVQLGSLVMEEFLEYMDQVSKAPLKTVDSQLLRSLPNRPSSEPNFWTGFYSREEMKQALAKVKLIAYRETVSIHGALSVSAYSSGYSIGSTNWTICSDYEKISYMAASSSRASHTKPVDWEHLKGCSTLLLTSVSRAAESSPEESVHLFCRTVLDTVQRGGNVLIPIAPTGVLYDLIECVIGHLNQSTSTLDIPIYFISPVAESALAYANIYAEWLSDKKQEKIYWPEEPFGHSSLLKSRRLQPFASIHEDLANEYRTPCIVFTGHPSLRLGDVIHFMEIWRQNAKNVIIFTDPDYSMEDALRPFIPMEMRAYYYPIDTRLDYGQINQTIMRDLDPPRLILPEFLTRPPRRRPPEPTSSLTMFVWNFLSAFFSAHSFIFRNYTSYRVGESVEIGSAEQDIKRIRLDPQVAREMDIRSRPPQFSESGVCFLNGYLSAYDNVFELKPESSEKENDGKMPVLRPCLTGKLDPRRFSDLLTKMSLRPEYLHDQGKIRVPEWSATVEILAGGQRTKICCESKRNRQKLADIIAKCLTAL